MPTPRNEKWVLILNLEVVSEFVHVSTLYHVDQIFGFWAELIQLSCLSGGRIRAWVNEAFGRILQSHKNVCRLHHADLLNSSTQK